MDWLETGALQVVKLHERIADCALHVNHQGDFFLKKTSREFFIVCKAIDKGGVLYSIRWFGYTCRWVFFEISCCVDTFDRNAKSVTVRDDCSDDGVDIVRFFSFLSRVATFSSCRHNSCSHERQFHLFQLKTKFKFYSENYRLFVHVSDVLMPL